MIIGIDASRSNVKQKTGTEYYSYEIIKGLAAISEDTLRLYSKTPIEYLKPSKNIQFKEMHFPRLWSQFRLSLEIFQNAPDVLFEPSHTIPLYHGKKTVVTLHDAGFKYYPELYTPLERFYHNFSMGFSVKHASKIIAISEATKKDLIKFYNADPKKITVIYHGYDKEKFFEAKPTQAKPEEIAKLGKYIYFIGRLEAKKNIRNLVKAYGMFRKNSDNDHKLVLAGRPGYQFEEIMQEIESLPAEIKKDIIRPGYIPDEIMADYLRFADIFAFPSRFEGFGMPLVESMACGVPIVASNTTSIPEIVGDAGLLVGPDDILGLANSFESVANNNDLRKKLIEAGKKRLSLFDWKECARKTLDVIEAASKEN